MRRGQKTHVKIDGAWHDATYLGKGAYSIVFKVENRAVIFTKDDCAKEVMALFQHSRMMHLPEVIRHDPVVIGKTHYQVYSSPIYRDVTRKDRQAYWLATNLIHFYVDHYAEGSATRKVPGIYMMQNFVDEVEAAETLNDQYKLVPKFPRSIVKALQEIVDVSSNCGSQVGFDIHMKNFGVNEYGVLIFRDLVNPLTHEYK